MGEGGKGEKMGTCSGHGIDQRANAINGDADDVPAAQGEIVCRYGSGSGHQQRA